MTGTETHLVSLLSEYLILSERDFREDFRILILEFDLIVSGTPSSSQLVTFEVSLTVSLLLTSGQGRGCVTQGGGQRSVVEKSVHCPRREI